MGCWSPPSGCGGSGPDAEQRCGTYRRSMETNVLLVKAPLGKPKATTFMSANNSQQQQTQQQRAAPAGGLMSGEDSNSEDGVRAAISSWRSHVPNPHTQPGPDFRSMDKAAAANGLVTSQQFRAFRAIHPVTLRRGASASAGAGAGAATAAASPPASAATAASGGKKNKKEAAPTYGMPAGFRSAEVQRACGPQEPAMKALMQHAYGCNWVAMNEARQGRLDRISPRSTGAARGHALGALRVMAATQEAGQRQQQQWKMARFEARAVSRVVQYMGGRGDKDASSSSGAA